MIVYLDMDGPLANFDKAIEGAKLNAEGDPVCMFEKGFFRNLEVTPGAKHAVDIISGMDCELYIASKPSTKNLWSATEKYQWIEEHFPTLLRRIFLTCDKGFLKGDLLIDDDAKRWRKGFQGTFVEFDVRKPIESWADALEICSICGWDGNDPCSHLSPLTQTPQDRLTLSADIEFVDTPADPTGNKMKEIK